MSDEDKDQKTEQPSQKKLKDLRKKGQIPRSQEVVSATLTLLLFAYFWLFWPSLFVNFKEMLIIPTQFINVPFDIALKQVFDLIFNKFLLIVLPFAFLVIVGTIIANVMQVGMIFSVESIKPDLSKISPAKGLKKIFAFKNLLETIKALIKVAFLSSILYFVLRENLELLIKIPYCGLGCLILLMQHLIKQVAMYALPIFIVLAAIDIFLQKIIFLKDNKMTKEEVKKEHKNSEGDPQSKGRRKSMHKEMAMDDTTGRVQSSSAIIMGNGKAIGIYYERGVTQLPIIMTIGKGLIAKQVADIARKENIMIVDDVVLADELVETGKIDQHVPSNCLTAVGKVMRNVSGKEKPQ
jgi:type III secretion protein U